METSAADPDPEVDPAVEEATEEECADELYQLASDQRLWVRTITAFLSARHLAAGHHLPMSTESTEDLIEPRTRHALNKATIAACERLVRIFGSDVASCDERWDA